MHRTLKISGENFLLRHHPEHHKFALQMDEEVETLLSIYPDRIEYIARKHVLIYNENDDAKCGFIVKFQYPVSGYPESAPLSIVSLTLNRYKHDKNELICEVSDLLIQKQIEGDVAVFACIDFIREVLHRDTQDSPSCNDDAECGEVVGYDDSWGRSASIERMSSGITIFHGEPLVDKKSVFIAHFARVKSMEDVNAFRREIVSDKKYARATHNIFAYRFTSAVDGIVHHDCDDDGETAAGGRLAEIVRLMGAMDVAVIVSRWFGGVKLGPERFKLINNVARNLLEQHDVITNSRSSKKKN